MSDTDRYTEARTNLVDSDRCVWCKEEPEDDVSTVELGTGEVICEPCLGDCRQYKRTVDFTTIMSTDIPEDARYPANAAAYAAARAVLDEHGYTGTDWGRATSNATGHSAEPGE